MPSSTPSPKVTIWIWPTALFPRRLIYYFRAKNISISTLTAHNIHLIPVTYRTELASKPGYEARPDGATLPCMHVEYHDGASKWVYESLAIIGWLEETFATVGGENDIMGSNRAQRAKTGDIVSLATDANFWSGLELMHSDPSSTEWSGLSADQMSASAAAHAKRRFNTYIGRLEKWIENDIIENQTKSVSGHGANVTLADIVLMASMAYAEEASRKIWLEQSKVLKAWCEQSKGEGWFVGHEELQKCEEEGFKAVLGN